MSGPAEHDGEPPANREGTPFRFEGPVSPGLLIDRQTELATLARRVGVRLAAPRRYGKTSLLVAHAAQLRETGWLTAHVDLGRVSDLTDVARRIAAAYGALDAGWMRAHLGGLLARLGLSVGTTGASATLGPRPASPDAEAAEIPWERRPAPSASDCDADRRYLEELLRQAGVTP